MVLEQLDILMQKFNLDTDFLPFTKISSKWIIDLNVKGKTIKVLEDNTEENLGDPGFGYEFSDTTPNVQCMKEKKLMSWTLLILRASDLQKTLLRNGKTSHRWGVYICKTPSDKGLVSQMEKKLLKLNSKKASNPI